MVKPKILAYLKEHFISVRIDFDQEKEIVNSYGVRGIPDIWFLDSQGNRLKRLSGFVPADTFYLVLHYFHEEAFKKMTFKEFAQQNG